MICKTSLVFLALLVGCFFTSLAQAAQPFRILVFTKTAPKGYHDSGIPAATAALKALGPANGFIADSNDDATVFTDEGLKPYQVLVFLNTDGEVLDESQQQALKHYIEAGGGFVGIHAVADTHKNWPWFVGLVGAALATDRHYEPGTLHVVDRNNPSTRDLPETFTRKDQWFRFKDLPKDVHVLITVDGTKLTDLDIHDTAYPVAWCHTYDGGPRQMN
jgi:type 1 glutamine amidotransferase